MAYSQVDWKAALDRATFHLRVAEQAVLNISPDQQAQAHAYIAVAWVSLAGLMATGIVPSQVVFTDD